MYLFGTVPTFDIPFPQTPEACQRCPQTRREHWTERFETWCMLCFTSSLINYFLSSYVWRLKLGDKIHQWTNRQELCFLALLVGKYLSYKCYGSQKSAGPSYLHELRKSLPLPASSFVQWEIKCIDFECLYSISDLHWEDVSSTCFCSFSSSK